MDTIKVKKAELLDKVRQNREDHAKDYTEAMIAYKEEAIKALEILLTAAKTGDIRHTIDVVKPREFLKDYDRAIKMLEMGQEEILEITLIDFD